MQTPKGDELDMTAPVDLDALAKFWAPIAAEWDDDAIAVMDMIAELRAARQDAARYRLLRDEVELSPRDVFGAMCQQLNSGLDAAIDAAIAKGGPT